ncbi:hypothetical protein EV363DRAFT_1346345 [Boletus edulis]|nr:hypothetical protein EV363DRAFT_1346345 [Boletus edulis]
MSTGSAYRCLAVSEDNKRIAAGTQTGDVFVWDAKTYEQVFKDSLEDAFTINGLDFSLDSTQIVSASDNRTAIVWDVANGKQVQILRHDARVLAAKYSPRGDQIATATWNFVRVWDSSDGRSLVEIKVHVDPWYGTGLWFNDHLFVVSMNKIKQFDVSTGSAVAEWLAPGSNYYSCIALPKHGEVIAYSTNNTLTTWCTLTHTQLALIQHDQNIHAIAFSPDDRFLAIGGRDGKISIKRLRCNTDSIPPSRQHPTFKEPDIEIDEATLDLWMNDQFENADALLTAAISTTQNPIHHVLASRALVRTRLQLWDIALVDATMAINIQPSVAGFIAKSLAHVGKGERDKAYRTCDIAFEHFHSSHLSFLLLVKAIIVFMAGEHPDAISRVDNLIDTVPTNTLCYTVQAYMHLLFGSLQMERGDYEASRAQTRDYFGPPLFVISLMSGWKFDNLGIKIQQRLCEALYAVGRSKDAGKFLLEMVNTLDDKVYTSVPITKWVSDIAQQCLSTLDNDGNVASTASRHGDLRALHVTINSHSPTPLLTEWAKATLVINKWKDALAAASNLKIPRVTIYRVICERLETIDCVADAVECFHEMASELGEETNLHDEHLAWALDFSQRSFQALERLGDTAVDTERYDEAISHYTTALSLMSSSPQVILIKRSKAWLAIGWWERALDDANRVIALDPSSPWGYEMKHIALHKGGDYDNAADAFETMLTKMAESLDPDVQRHGDQYISPSSTRATIRKIIHRTQRHSPRVLINTTTGHLHNRAEQASAFESLPIFKELVSSTTTRIDYVRIKREVREYFRYVMLSHKWEDNEPLFQQVVHIAVYDLEESPTHDKLQTFCKIVRNAGFDWAWSDTCCIDKSDHFILQEALVAMFKWYQGSAMMIVFLRGVSSSSQRGALVRSIWNTRAWTLQEYVASKVIHFYTEDWTPYLDLQLPNHKESPQIIAEMEQATGVSAEQLMALRTGLTSIREQLRLASTRETTVVEDTAYSLLGIFSVTGMPAIYGEGEDSLGRLLAHILAGSGDASILAWTGESGSFNSCLPAHITVFNGPATLHLPRSIPDVEMERVIAALQPSFYNQALRLHNRRNSDLNVALRLYDCLNDLPAPWFAVMFIVRTLSPLGRWRSKRDKISRGWIRCMSSIPGWIHC